MHESEHSTQLCATFWSIIDNICDANPQLNTVLGAKSGEHKFKDSENDVMVFQRWSDKQKILKSEMTTTRWKKYIYIHILMDKISCRFGCQFP